MIFAGLAIGWAVYLIPKALQHHDEMARTRSVDSFSQRMRVLGGGPAATSPQPDTIAAPVLPAARKRPAAAVTPTVHTVTREAARRAARRRRRVLGLLVLATAVLGVLVWRAVVPTWSVAVPGGAIPVFLVIARLTVRRERARRPVPAVAAGEPEFVDLETEDTAEVSRQELADAVAAPVLDEGSLWDPLPVTLPTYVSKPTARRTVRTIELTGMSSSGHDAADSALVRESEAAAHAAEAEKQAEAETEQRRAAGA